MEESDILYIQVQLFDVSVTLNLSQTPDVSVLPGYNVQPVLTQLPHARMPSTHKYTYVEQEVLLQTSASIVNQAVRQR